MPKSGSRFLLFEIRVVFVLRVRPFSRPLPWCRVSASCYYFVRLYPSLFVVHGPRLPFLRRAGRTEPHVFSCLTQTKPTCVHWKRKRTLVPLFSWQSSFCLVRRHNSISSAFLAALMLSRKISPQVKVTRKSQRESLSKQASSAADILSKLCKKKKKKRALHPRNSALAWCHRICFLMTRKNASARRRPFLSSRDARSQASLLSREGPVPTPSSSPGALTEAGSSARLVLVRALVRLRRVTGCNCINRGDKGSFITGAGNVGEWLEGRQRWS